MDLAGAYKFFFQWRLKDYFSTIYLTGFKMGIMNGKTLTDWTVSFLFGSWNPFLGCGPSFSMIRLHGSLEGFDSWHVWVTHMPWDFPVGRADKEFQGTIETNACAAHQGEKESPAICQWSLGNVLYLLVSRVYIICDCVRRFIFRHCAMWPRFSVPHGFSL